MTRRLPALLALLLASQAAAAPAAEPAAPPPGARGPGAGTSPPEAPLPDRGPSPAPEDLPVHGPSPTGGAADSRADREASPSAAREGTGVPTPTLQPSPAREASAPAPRRRPIEPPRIPVRAIEVRDPRTILVAAAGPAEAIARDLAPALPEERRALDRLLGLSDELPIEIRVGYGRDEFRSLQPASAPAPGWAAGVAYPAVGLVILDAQASGRSGSVQGVLRHELAHVTLGRLLQTRIPHWFTEGFAMLYADEWTLSRSAVLVRASAAGTLIPLDDIDRSWPSSPSDVDLAYAQSANFVSFLAGIDDGAPFHRLVALMSEGTPFADAVVAAYGQPLLVHELAWKRTLRARFGWLPVLFDHELLWAWAALLAVIGAWRIRRRKLRRLAAMADDLDDPEPDEGDDDHWDEETDWEGDDPGAYAVASTRDEATSEDDFTTWTGPGSRLLH
ncbi:MAG TPA: peptidase MA family metallohydrolase [Vulgatibacter sp.]|nr:peptidase MA family metallohydrolase [Vulgatibacter sp.]